jgi:hypothetical protein
MKEREKPFRSYLVCYDGERCIGWKNVAELNELLNQGSVNWYLEEGGHAVKIKTQEGRLNEQKNG